MRKQVKIQFLSPAQTLLKKIDAWQRKSTIFNLYFTTAHVELHLAETTFSRVLQQEYKHFSTFIQFWFRIFLLKILSVFIIKYDKSDEVERGEEDIGKVGESRCKKLWTEPHTSCHPPTPTPSSSSSSFSRSGKEKIALPPNSSSPSPQFKGIIGNDWSLRGDCPASITPSAPPSTPIFEPSIFGAN